MTWLLLGILLLFASIVLAHVFISASPRAMAKTLRIIGGFASLFLSLPFVLRGNLMLGLPLIVLGTILLRNNLGLAGSSGLFGNTQKSSGQTSNIATKSLRMRLDHDSGVMDGEVLTGVFKGRSLSAMEISDLLDFLRQCRQNDPDAASLLDTYLQRHRQEELDPDWGKFEAGAEPPSHTSAGPMSMQEARDILGVRSSATRETILAAHKRLMLKVHPDQGGSNYLASKINQAKDVLLAG